jgi:hypothetical protein
MKKSRKTRPATFIWFDVSSDAGLHQLRVFMFHTKLNWDVQFMGEEFTILSRPRFTK